MNEKSESPILVSLVDVTNARLSDYDKLLCEIREVIDRINVNSPKVESLLNKTSASPSVAENTIVTRISILNDSLGRANDKLREIYDRLRELV